MTLPAIPALDPTPLPAPAWLFQALLLVTFFVHLLFLNVTLGGCRRQARRTVEELVRRRLAGLAYDAARGPAGEGAVGPGIGQAIVLEATRVGPP